MKTFLPKRFGRTLVRVDGGDSATVLSVPSRLARSDPDIMARSNPHDADIGRPFRSAVNRSRLQHTLAVSITLSVGREARRGGVGGDCDGGTGQYVQAWSPTSTSPPLT